MTIKMPALPVRSPWDNNDNHSSNHHNPLHAEEEEETPLLHRDNAKATAKDRYPRQAYITHPTAMPGWRAFLGGQLSTQDYLTLFNFLLLLTLVLVLGLLFAATEEPSYAGNVVWCGVWVLVLSVMPLVKYVNSLCAMCQSVASRLLLLDVAFG